MNKISTVIIGFGNIGYFYDHKKNQNFIETHYRAINQNKKYKLLGVVEKNFNKIKIFQKKINVPTFLNLNLLHKNIKKVDLFIVASDLSSHFTIIKQITKFYNPKIIFCEKPFCQNEFQAKKIIKLCNANRIKLMINYQRRVDKNILFLKKFMNFKNNTINVYFSKSILINGSHFIDLFTNIFGKVSKVDNLIIKKPYHFIFSLFFKRAKINFHKVKNNSSMKNFFIIENKKYIISKTKNFFIIKKKIDNEKIFLKNNPKIMLQNTHEISKVYRNKKSLLCKGLEALDIHKIINRIEYN